MLWGLVGQVQVQTAASHCVLGTAAHHHHHPNVSNPTDAIYRDSNQLMWALNCRVALCCLLYRHVVPQNMRYRPRGDGHGPHGGSKAPIGAHVGEVKGGAIDWGYLATRPDAFGSSGYDLLSDPPPEAVQQQGEWVVDLCAREAAEGKRTLSLSMRVCVLCRVAVQVAGVSAHS